MKEYTLLAAVFSVVTVLIDRLSGVYVLKRKEYYVFLTVILFFKFLVNGYLTGKNIVVYKDIYYLGMRLGSIPLEDFFFGFSMVTLTIIFWERFKLKRAK